MSRTATITRSGAYVDLLSPDPATLHLRDIAVALGNQRRWNGHGAADYTVAAHSINVMHRVRDLGGNKSEQAAGLMHDAAEAYTGDASNPMKIAMRLLMPDGGPSPLDMIAKRLNDAIAGRFGVAIGALLPDVVRQADADLLAVEAYAWWPDDPRGWAPMPRSPWWPPPYEGHRTFLDFCRVLGIQ